MSVSQPLAAAIDLLGVEHPFVACTHAVHVCDTRCKACGCCEHCEVDCACQVQGLPEGVFCPGEYDGCGCSGSAGPLRPHTPDRVSIDECGNCDSRGLTGGDLPPQREETPHA